MREAGAEPQRLAFHPNAFHPNAFVFTSPYSFCFPCAFAGRDASISNAEYAAHAAAHRASE